MIKGLPLRLLEVYFFLEKRDDKRLIISDIYKMIVYFCPLLVYTGYTNSVYLCTDEGQKRN
jgi:hypothetical protein